MTNGKQEGHGLMRQFSKLSWLFISEFFVTAREDRYDLMCGLYAQEKRKYKSTGTTDFHGGQHLP